MEFVQCRHCGHMIPEDEIECINCERETGFHDHQNPVDVFVDDNIELIVDTTVSSNFTNNSDAVKYAHLSFEGDADTKIELKSISSFSTEILGVRKQPGQKYTPKPGKSVWKEPMLEVITKHGVYITYGTASWVTECFQHKEVFVWTENTTREGWLWIHEGRNFSANQETQCKGCCGLSVNQLSPF